MDGVEMINADEIPRYKMPTADELEAMYGDVASPCETCKHCINVKVWLRSRTGATRTIQVCVVEHDEDGDDFGTLLVGAIDQCGGWELAE